jgi:putative ABC transport system permease protein
VNLIEHALRQLRARPGLSFVVILMLALGIGATTAMFSLYHQILVRPLPVPEAERLVNLAAPGPKGGTYRDLAIYDPDAQFSYEMFRDLEREQTVFTGLAAHTDFIANLSFGDQPAYGRGWLVSGSYFGVLSLEPALGRLIGREDEPRIGESAVVVLSYDYWQSRFGGNPDVLGETLTVNGQALEIIGVAPAGFTGTTLGTRALVFVPLSLRWLMNPTLGPYRENRQNNWAYLFARLEPGVTMARAATELNVVYSAILNEVEAPLLGQSQIPVEMLEQFRRRQITLSPGARGQSPVPGTAGRPLALLLGVTALVLLIVCVNIVNLLLARAASRTGEMAVRTSIGASRGRLVRQLLAECFVLIAIGGALSLAVAALIVRLVTGLLPRNLAVGLAPELSAAAMLFAAGASLVTVLVFGLAPALSASGTDAAEVMKAHATRSSGGRAAVRFRSVLMTAQIAFSLVLLVLAGLFTRSLMNVNGEDLGMAVDSIVSFSITPHLNAYDPEQLASLYDRLEERLAAQPGVIAVGSSGIAILYDFSLGRRLSVEGFEATPGFDTSVAFSMVGSGFFDALGVPLIAGRAFTDRDTADSPQVAIVNSSFARKFNLDNPIGRRVGGGGNYPIEIVGLVADAKHASVKGETPALIYVPRRQAAGTIQAMWYYVRDGIDPQALRARIPRIVADVDPDVPVAILETLRDRMEQNVYIDRLLSMLSVGFAALATLLAGIGLYGVLAYNIAHRTRELGLRLALGAAPVKLRTMVLKQVGAMALIGGAIGLVAALALGRLAEALLFGLSGRDPAVIAAAAAVLAAVVLAGSWLPARRASSISPMQALRYE